MGLIEDRHCNMSTSFMRPDDMSAQETKRFGHRLKLFLKGYEPTVDIGLACLTRREQVGATERLSFKLYFDEWFHGKQPLDDKILQRVRRDIFSSLMDETDQACPNIVAGLVRTSELTECGITFGDPTIDLKK